MLQLVVRCGSTSNFRSRKLAKLTTINLWVFLFLFSYAFYKMVINHTGCLRMIWQTATWCLAVRKAKEGVATPPRWANGKQVTSNEIPRQLQQFWSTNSFRYSLKILCPTGGERQGTLFIQISHRISSSNRVFSPSFLCQEFGWVTWNSYFFKGWNRSEGKLCVVFVNRNCVMRRTSCSEFQKNLTKC